MAEFGISEDGFNIKPIDVVLRESMDRARLAFGSTVDLTASSPLRKILEVTAAEDVELWKRMEDLYYGNFISTAFGDNLDLLGEDLGITRRNLFASGTVQFTLGSPVTGRDYLIPQGTVVVTAAPIRAFYTTEFLHLSSATPTATVGINAFERGPVAGNVPPAAIIAVDPGYVLAFLDLGTATLTVTNPAATTGGEQLEDNETYRIRLIGFPRTMWTLQSVQRTAREAGGVTDVLAFDPLGGVDVSQSYFNLFSFNQRVFGGERRLGEPYFFTLVVAHEPEWPWRTAGPVRGVFELVKERVDAVRPVGIYANIVEADHIEVGVEASVILRAGFDADAVVAAIKLAIAANVSSLRLGGDVLYSQIMRAFVEQTGVVDVQRLHLRRWPPQFGRVSFGNVPFQTDVIEAAAGENLLMGSTEMPIFRGDSEFSAIEVVFQ